jgi:hypothetical protein
VGMPLARANDDEPRQMGEPPVPLNPSFDALFPSKRATTEVVTIFVL